MKKIILLLGCACLANLPSAYALGLDVGALGGYSTLSSGGISTSGFGVGGRADLSLIPSWSAGAEWVYQSTTPSTGVPQGYSSNESVAVVNIDYHLPILEDLFIGLKVGLGFTSAGGSSGSSFAIGGEAGYDYKLMDHLTVGPQINFVSVSAPTINGVSGSSITIFQALAAVKYWL